MSGSINYHLQVTVPVDIILFRYKMESPLAGVALLWSVPGVHSYGIDHVRLEHLVDDTLHTLALGVYQKFAGLCLAQALKRNVFRVTGAGQEERYQKSMFIIRRRLRLHYRVLRIKMPGHKQSRIRHLTLSNLGKLKNPTLAAKGGQTVDIVPFCTRLMHECAAQGQVFQLLAKAGRAITIFEETYRSEPLVMSTAGVNLLLTNCVTHCVAFKLAGGITVPKHHAWIHLCHGARWSGNPKGYSTYGDESENGLAAKQGRFAHPFAFAFTVMQKQVALERLGASA